jgi:hypothetical protein
MALMVKQPKKKKKPEAGQKEVRMPERQDLPEAGSIIGEEEFISPKGNKYKIILTDELDAYEYDDDAPERS